MPFLPRPSPLLLQIRKMVGLAVEMTRSSRSLEQISNLYNACFQPDRKVPGIPMVPGLGLYLDELFFEKYNLKLKYDDEKRERAALNKQRRGESGAQEEEKEDTSISVSPFSLLSHPTVYPTLTLSMQPVSRLEWSGEPATTLRFETFKREVLYPHIASQVSMPSLGCLPFIRPSIQERTSLEFVSYLEFLSSSPQEGRYLSLDSLL
jgi:hypothetical protein